MLSVSGSNVNRASRRRTDFISSSSMSSWYDMSASVARDGVPGVPGVPGVTVVPGASGVPQGSRDLRVSRVSTVSVGPDSLDASSIPLVPFSPRVCEVSIEPAVSKLASPPTPPSTPTPPFDTLNVRWDSVIVSALDAPFDINTTLDRDTSVNGRPVFFRPRSATRSSLLAIASVGGDGASSGIDEGDTGGPTVGCTTDPTVGCAADPIATFVGDSARGSVAFVPALDGADERVLGDGDANVDFVAKSVVGTLLGTLVDMRGDIVVEVRVNFDSRLVSIDGVRVTALDRLGSVTDARGDLVSSGNDDRDDRDDVVVNRLYSRDVSNGGLDRLVAPRDTTTGATGVIGAFGARGGRGMSGLTVPSGAVGDFSSTATFDITGRTGSTETVCSASSLGSTIISKPISVPGSTRVSDRTGVVGLFGVSGVSGGSGGFGGSNMGSNIGTSGVSRAPIGSSVFGVSVFGDVGSGFDAFNVDEGFTEDTIDSLVSGCCARCNEVSVLSVVTALVVFAVFVIVVLSSFATFVFVISLFESDS